MQCHVCGTEVRPEHKFCMECGARLRGAHASIELAPPDPATAFRRAVGEVGRSPSGHGMFDPVTGHIVATATERPARSGDDVPLDDDATKVLPALGEPVMTFAPPDPTPGAGLPWSSIVDR